jgi:hypothetical protein
VSEWAVIDYREYWDVPREFVVRHGEDAYYFQSPFDEILDDYTPNFYVYRIPVALADAPMDRWSEFRRLGERLPDIPVSQLRFRAEPIQGHPLGRHLRFVHESVFELLKKTGTAT